jgi:MacB-like periplasmic core domain
VSGSYFATMGIPLIAGRVFTEQDNLNHPRVVVIDEALARRFFPQGDAVGKHLQVPDAKQTAREIIGMSEGFAIRASTSSRAPRSISPLSRLPTRP